MLPFVFYPIALSLKRGSDKRVFIDEKSERHDVAA